MNIAARDGFYVYHLGNRFLNIEVEHKDDAMRYTFTCENNLKPGVYLLTLFLRAEDAVQDWLPDAIAIEITKGSPYGYPHTDRIQGCVFPEFSFEVD